MPAKACQAVCPTIVDDGAELVYVGFHGKTKVDQC